MEYLIIVFKKNNDNPVIEEKHIMNEKEMFGFIQNNVGNKDFTVNKIECVLDFS